MENSNIDPSVALDTDLFTFIICQDKEEKKRFENQTGDFCAFKWLLNNQGQSTDWALRHGGWSVEVINERTKFSDFWKPYSR